MISFIRRNIKKEVSLAIVGAMVLILAFGSVIPELIRRFSGHDNAVRINRYDISMRDYVTRVHEEQEKINSIRARFGQHANMIMQALGMSGDPKILALSGLIQDTLLDQAADQMNLQLSETHVAKELADPRFLLQEFGHMIPPYLIGAAGTVNVPAVQDFLAKRGMTEYFERTVEGRLRRALLLDIVGNTAYVPNFQLRSEFEAQYVPKKFAIATFDYEGFVAQEKRTEVTDEQARTFFNEQNAQSKRYWVPAQRSGTFWKFAADDYDITVSEQEVEEAYNRSKQGKYREKGAQVNVRRILIKTDAGLDVASQKMGQIKQELDLDPSRFADLARQHSQDADTASSGGTTGFFEKGTRDESFERVAFTLKDNGSISAPFKTADGIEIVQRVDKKPAVFKSLSSVRKDIVKTLTEQKFKRLFVKEADQALHGSAKDLQDFITSHEGSQGSTGLVTKDESTVNANLFKLRKAKDGDRPAMAFIDNGVGIILQLDESSEAHAQKFDEAKARVMSDIRADRAHDSLRKAIDEAAQRVKAGATLADAIKGLGKISLERTGALKAGDSTEMEALSKRGLPVQKMFQLEKAGAVTAQVGLHNGYLVQLESVEKVNDEEFAKHRPEIMAKMRNDQKALFDGAFIASLYRGAKIIPNESIIKQS